MTETFNKFGWIKALRTDHRFTDQQFRVGVAICTDFTWKDGVGWAVNLAEIGASVPTALHPETVKTALHKLVTHGYLVEVGRSKGGRGVKAWRELRLAKPTAVGLHLKPETRSGTAAGLAETHSRAPINPQPCTGKPTAARLPKTSSELEEEPPQGISPELSPGLKAAARAGEREVSTELVPDNAALLVRSEIPDGRFPAQIIRDLRSVVKRLLADGDDPAMIRGGLRRWDAHPAARGAGLLPRLVLDEIKATRSIEGPRTPTAYERKSLRNLQVLVQASGSETPSREMLLGIFDEYVVSLWEQSRASSIAHPDAMDVEWTEVPELAAGDGGAL